MPDNPSIVNDASGNNYGGIGRNLAQEANTQYLDQLQQLASTTPRGAQAESTYYPGYEQGIQVGGVSSKTLGSVPLFATGGGVLPWGMFDASRKAQADAEVSVLEKMGTQLSKPLMESMAKLKNPFAQPEFNAKIQETSDKWLDTYASRFNGDYMKAYIALSNDREFNKTMNAYSDYADIYNFVYDDAMKTLEKDGDKLNYYVPPQMVKNIQDFVVARESIDELSPDVLAEKARSFKSQISVYKLAEAATDGYKASTIDKYTLDPNMSTEQKSVWVKTTTEGSKADADNIITNILKANPWIEEDANQKSLLETTVRNQVAFGIKKSIEQIDKVDANRNMDLRAQGINIDANGKIIFPTKPAALVAAVGENAVSYPVSKTPIPSVTGMYGYIVHNGKLRAVRLPDSYDMIPTAEYDITKMGTGIKQGRYVESKIDFQNKEQYSAENVRTATKDGKITDALPLGYGRGTTQVMPVKLKDAFTGEDIEIFGETTILTPYENMKGAIEANYKDMGYVHSELERQSYPNEGMTRRTTKAGNNSAPITLPADASMEMVEDDPNALYTFDGKTTKTGQELWRIYNQETAK